MKLLKLTILCAAMALSGIADAKGGMSSGGGRSMGGGMSRSSGGFSSSGARPAMPMSAPRPNTPPSVAPTVRPNSQPSIAPNTARPNSQPSISPNTAATTPRTTTTTTTSTTMTRRTAGGGYMGSPVMYGGMGMGYGYSNGLMTGLIIGNMMHPHNTVIYAGGGAYNNNALLYPDGRVVNQQGYQVGTYANGQFNAVNGGMVAQQAPSDAYTSTTQPQQVVMVKQGPTWGEITMMVLVGIAAIVLVFVIIF